jgi:hypothetical protein
MIKYKYRPFNLDLKCTEFWLGIAIGLCISSVAAPLITLAGALLWWSFG